MKPSKRDMVPVSTFEVLIQSRSLSTFIKEPVKHFRIALFTKILYAINYFHKKPHHKCLTRFLIKPLKSVITNNVRVRIRGLEMFVFSENLTCTVGAI